MCFVKHSASPLHAFEAASLVQTGAVGPQRSPRDACDGANRSRSFGHCRTLGRGPARSAA